jgi:hypothetical protein
MAVNKARSRRQVRKRKPRKVVHERPLDPFEAYGNSSPHNLTHELRSDLEDGNTCLQELLDAIHAIDQFHLENRRETKAPLIQLLMSRGTTRTENALLADLFDRLVLKWPVGARRRPAYLISEDDHVLINALYDVELLKTRGTKVGAALAQIAKKRDIPLEKLVAAQNGQRRSMRERKSRNRLAAKTAATRLPAKKKY